MLSLLVDRPKTLSAEWVLSSRTAPAHLFEKLLQGGFREGKGGVYLLDTETGTFSIRRQSRKDAMILHLYYARFEGLPAEGKPVLDYVCEHFGLEMRALEVFVPDARRNKQHILHKAGFTDRFSASSGLATTLVRQEVAAIVFQEGYILQIRGKHLRDWERLHKLMFGIMKELRIQTGIEKAV